MHANVQAVGVRFDFGTQNFNFKINVQMENKTPTNHENGNDANRLLAEVPYCTDCGSEDLTYLAQYANGEYWKCKECGKQFIHELNKDD
jgi:transposase-like protein